MVERVLDGGGIFGFAGPRGFASAEIVVVLANMKYVTRLGVVVCPNVTP
jgi:hypothetical protein